MNVFQEVVLAKEGGPLGLSIIGGIDQTSTPFGANEPGVFISKVGSLFFMNLELN